MKLVDVFCEVSAIRFGLCSFGNIKLFMRFQ